MQEGGGKGIDRGEQARGSKGRKERQEERRQGLEKDIEGWRWEKRRKENKGGGCPLPTLSPTRRPSLPFFLSSAHP